MDKPMKLPCDGCGDSKTVGRKPWKKNLYENQGYPDNYTDHSFLTDMKKNIHFYPVTFLEAIAGASLVTQELCLVIFFCIIFYYMDNDLIEPLAVFNINSALTILGYFIYIYYESGRKWKPIQAISFFLVLGYILSPLLKTLTETISTDTIYTTTVFMMLIHLIFFDYGVKAVIVSSSLSTNAALFGSVCLASRLPTPFHCFVLLTTCVQCFVYCPLILSKLGSARFCLLPLMVMTDILYLYSVSQTMSNIFLIALVFLNVVCPYLFVRWHSYKDNIYGPWDEAVVNEIKC